jgi:hypothetical protein
VIKIAACSVKKDKGREFINILVTDKKVPKNSLLLEAHQIAET